MDHPDLFASPAMCLDNRFRTTLKSSTLSGQASPITRTVQRKEKPMIESILPASRYAHWRRKPHGEYLCQRS